LRATLGLSGLADPDIFLSGDALSKFSLEGAAGRVKNKLGRKAWADWSWLFGGLGLLVGVEGDCGFVQGEAVNFGIKVKVAGSRSRRGSSLSSRTASWLSRTSSGGSNFGGLFISGNVEKVVEGRSGSGSVLRTRSGANAVLVLSLSSLGLNGKVLGPLGSWPGRVWDLRVLQLNSGGGPETIAGIDWILLGNLVVVSSVDGSSFTSFGSGVAGQTADVGELALATVGIDVTVLAASDAVNSASLFPEWTVFSDVAEGEAAVLVVVRVVVGRLDGLLSRFVGNALALLSLLFSGGGFDTWAGVGVVAAGNVWRVSPSAGGQIGDIGSWGRGRCGRARSGSWQLNDWLLGWFLYFGEENLRFFFFLWGCCEKWLKCIRVLKWLSVVDGHLQVLIGRVLVQGGGKESGGIRLLNGFGCWNSSQGNWGSNLRSLGVVNVCQLRSRPPEPQTFVDAFLLGKNETDAKH
jgi:hypothetical protein